MRKSGVLLLLSLLALTSCKEGSSKNQRYLPGSTGAINSLIVVMENDLWKGEVGDKVRELFADRVLAVPQSEAILSLTQIPHQVFSGAITNSRSVLYIQKDSLSLGHVKSNVYATPQKVAVIKGRTNEDLLNNLEAIAPKAIALFKKTEISEAQKRFKKSLKKETDFKDEFGIELDIPTVYTVGKHEDNFIWIDRQILKGNMNIIAYSIPWNSFSNDSTFVQDIVKMRDSIGKKYVPGPYEGTYMITEKVFSPYVFPAEISGRKAAEVRGVWEMSGYPMAGPFLTYIINDKPYNRKLVLEGFTFAPATEKRDYMFELEAIMKTVKFNMPE